MDKLDDIALMAYLEGELDAAESRDVERAIQDSPDMRERAEALQRTIDKVRDTYSPVLEAPVPEHLISTIENFRAPAESVEHPKGGWRQQDWMRLAASVCLGIIVGAGGMSFLGTDGGEAPSTDRIVSRGAGGPDAAPDTGAIEGPTGWPRTFQEPERLAAFEEQLPAVLERTANGVAVTMTLSPTVTAEITPIESFLSTSGTFCRKARYQPVKQEAPPPSYFTACRADNGMWEIVSIDSPAEE